MNSNYDKEIQRLGAALDEAEALVIGAGAGMSTSAGFEYGGERFRKYFFDFEKALGFHDMYTGGWVVLEADPEVRWAYWARNIYFNRNTPPAKPAYKDLLELVKDKDFFVITTNVDHQFQKAGFPKSRLFYTQGDYGLFQSVNPNIRKTYDNEEWVNEAMEAQGFVRDEDGYFQVPEDGNIKMRIPTELLPKCPDDGSDMTTNLRSDETFVEDEGWHMAAGRYEAFLRKSQDRKTLFLELGVGGNTPVIIKYPFWRMTYNRPEATYACINYGEAVAPKEIEDRSICIDGDIGEVLSRLLFR